MSQELLLARKVPPHMPKLSADSCLALFLCVGFGDCFEFLHSCPRLTYFYPSWPIPVAHLLPGNTVKALRSGHCLTQHLGTACVLRTDLTFDLDISHRLTKCPGSSDLSHWLKSPMLDSQVQPYPSRLHLHLLPVSYR